MEILEIVLATNSISKTEKFYRDVLELSILSKTDDSICFEIGTSKLCFKKTNHLQPEYHFAFNIPHNQLNEALQWLSAKVQIIEISPGVVIADFVNWNAKSIYFYDSGGNIVELIARYDLENTSDLNFTSVSFQSISEIGVVTHDMAESIHYIQDINQISVYKKQPIFPKFAVFGDENGLIILSAINRNWYPTQKLVQQLPVETTLLINGKMEKLVFNQEY